MCRRKLNSLVRIRTTTLLVYVSMYDILTRLSLATARCSQDHTCMATARIPVSRTFLTHHALLDTETNRILSHSSPSHSTPTHVCIHSLAVALERDSCVFLEFFLLPNSKVHASHQKNINLTFHHAFSPPSTHPLLRCFNSLHATTFLQRILCVGPPKGRGEGGRRE